MPHVFVLIPKKSKPGAKVLLRQRHTSRQMAKLELMHKMRLASE